MNFKVFCAAAMSGAVFFSAPAQAQGVVIQYGDNSSTWANDGECDDPRFEGSGMAATLLDEDRQRDAVDCRTLLERGAIRLRATSVNFGDNTSTWANDGECDDPRFQGSGMASTLLEEDRLRDASDCRSLYRANRIQLVTASTGFNFGDNTSTWANDGECDDPRFEGPGAASTLLEEDRFRDGNDCRSLFNSGRIRLRAAYINFGDNTSAWANDGECDDPRFQGPGMAGAVLDENRFADSADCRALYTAGQIQLK